MLFGHVLIVYIRFTDTGFYNLAGFKIVGLPLQLINIVFTIPRIIMNMNIYKIVFTIQRISLQYLYYTVNALRLNISALMRAVWLHAIADLRFIKQHHRTCLRVNSIAGHRKVLCKKSIIKGLAARIIAR